LNSLARCFCYAGVLLAISSTLFAQPVFAQNAPSATWRKVGTRVPSARKKKTVRHHVETSVSVGAVAQLAATRISDTPAYLRTESMAPSAGVFATLRQSFKPWLGYSVNFGYGRPVDRYTVSDKKVTANAYAVFETNVPTSMYETSASYIAQRHMTNRLTAFGEAGAGVIGFAPLHHAGDLQAKSNNFVAEGIAGFGFDYRLAHGLGMRAQYRGLFIKYPYPDYSDSVRLRTIVSEPTLSVTYTFGQHGKR
jgi:hypothetical protein